jgi:hypothetical protein
MAQSTQISAQQWAPQIDYSMTALTGFSAPFMTVTALTINAVSTNSADGRWVCANSGHLDYRLQQIKMSIHSENMTSIGIYNWLELPKNQEEQLERKIESVFVSKDLDDQKLQTLLITKLENLRDNTGKDVFLHEITAENSQNSQNMYKIKLDCYLLGDVTIKNDIYLDPDTGEVRYGARNII